MHKKNLTSLFYIRTCEIWGAEREGFEPPDPRRSTVFKTAAFDRSAIFPIERENIMHIISSLNDGAKIQRLFDIAKKSFGRDNRNKNNGIKKCHKMLCLRKKYFEEFAII